MKILITGAGGYIGSVSAYMFLQKGYEVVAIDNFSTGYKDPLELLQKQFGTDKIRWYEMDLLELTPDFFTKEHDISTVIHYASPCLVNESMEKPDKYFKAISASSHLLEVMDQVGIKNLIFSSTSAVYGDIDYLPLDEKHKTGPLNPYGFEKLTVEQMIQWYGQLKGLNYVIMRYFNACAATDDGVIGDSKKPSSLLIQNAVRGALGIEPFYLTCPRVDTPDGTPIRDYINVVDLNNAHIMAVEYLQNGGSSEIINIGTGTGNSVLEVVETVEKVTGKKIEKNQTEPRKGEYAEAFADNTKAEKVLGWKPTHSIEDSINSLVKWYTTHPNGWDL